VDILKPAEEIVEMEPEPGRKISGILPKNKCSHK